MCWEVARSAGVSQSWLIVCVCVFLCVSIKGGGVDKHVVIMFM